MRPLLVLPLVAVVLAVAVPRAHAVEHVLVRWKKSGRCEIVTTLPRWGDHWLELGTYRSRGEAERALAEHRKSRSCPSSRSARRMDAPPDRGKAAPTYRRAEKAARY